MLRFVGIILLVQLSKCLQGFSMIYDQAYDIYDINSLAYFSLNHRVL